MRTFEDYFHEIAEAFSEIQGSHAALEARMERMFRKGKVTDVDAKNQLYRQEIGLDDDGKPVRSPWVPYAQVAGARKTHSPPSVGQQFLLVSPDGDHEQGHGIPLTFSKAVPSPSEDPKAHVDQVGDVKTTLTDKAHVREVKKAKLTHDENGLSIDCDGTTFTFTKDGFVQKGGKQEHEGKNVGATHKHGGVTPGNSPTDVPLA